MEESPGFILDSEESDSPLPLTREVSRITDTIHGNPVIMPVPEGSKGRKETMYKSEFKVAVCLLGFFGFVAGIITGIPELTKGTLLAIPPLVCWVVW